jgi:hypothetical protein
MNTFLYSANPGVRGFGLFIFEGADMLIDETHSIEVLIVAGAVMRGVLIFRITNKIKLGVVDDVIAFETGIFVTTVLFTPITDPTSPWAVLGFGIHMIFGFFFGIVAFRLMSGQGIRVVNPFSPRGRTNSFDRA